MNSGGGGGGCYGGGGGGGQGGRGGSGGCKKLSFPAFPKSWQHGTPKASPKAIPLMEAPASDVIPAAERNFRISSSLPRHFGESFSLFAVVSWFQNDP